MWILDFLTGRTQVVRVGGRTSSTHTIIKFADDTAAVGMITDNNEKADQSEVDGPTYS